MKKADKYVLLGISILLIISSLGTYFFKTQLSKNPLSKSGATAIITQNGLPIHKIDLNAVGEAYEATIQGDFGGYNKIYVEKNQITIIDANCPDQLCVKTGSLSYQGDIAVCLPHQLMIEIQSEEADQIDSLSY